MLEKNLKSQKNKHGTAGTLCDRFIFSPKDVSYFDTDAGECMPARFLPLDRKGRRP